MDGVARRARRPRPRRAGDRPGRPRGRRDLEGRRVSWIEKSRARLSVGEIAFVDAGDPEAPAVLLLSGGFTSSYVWRHLVPMLSPFMRAIAPDLLGSGRLRVAGGRRPAARAAREHHARAAGAPRDRTVRRRRSRPRRRDRAARRARRGREALVLIDSIAFDAWPSPSIAELRERVDVDPAFIRSWFDGFFDAGWATASGSPTPTSPSTDGRSNATTASSGSSRSPPRSTARASSASNLGSPSSRSRRSCCGARTTRSCPPSSPNASVTRSRWPRWRSCPAAGTSCSRTRPTPSSR